MIRFGLPDAKNPVGYIRFYNSFEQPLTVLGKPATDDLTHIPLTYNGKIQGWPR